MENFGRKEHWRRENELDESNQVSPVLKTQNKRFSSLTSLIVFESAGVLVIFRVCLLYNGSFFWGGELSL